MKKIILLLLFIPLVSFGQISRGETIDKMVKECVDDLIPMDFNNGIVWTNSLNEDNLKKVNIYTVSDEGLSVVRDYISKWQLVDELRKVPNKAGYKVSQEMKIVNIWRYYHNKNLIKEIIIRPEEW